MNVIMILFFASLFVASGFLIAFIWAVRSGQMDDKYTPSVRMLFDDAEPAGQNKDAKVISKNENSASKTIQPKETE